MTLLKILSSLKVSLIALTVLNGSFINTASADEVPQDTYVKYQRSRVLETLIRSEAIGAHARELPTGAIVLSIDLDSLRKNKEVFINIIRDMPSDARGLSVTVFSSSEKPVSQDIQNILRSKFSQLFLRHDFSICPDEKNCSIIQFNFKGLLC